MKVYRDHRYENRYMKPKKKFKGRVLAIAGVGVIVVSMIAFSKTSAKESEVNINEDSILIDSDSKEIVADDTFDVGSSEYKGNIIQYLSTSIGNLIYKYSSKFGVDPNIIASMAMQESSLNHESCIPGGEFYSGYGVGLLQLESPSGQEVSAYNYETNEIETEYITMDNACDIEKNIKIGCMIFQNSLDNNKGNVFLAIQSYNYGQPMIDYILYDMYGDGMDSIKANYTNTDWVSGIKEAHSNPSKYLFEWEGLYGDGNYIEDVLRFMPYNHVKYKYDGSEYEFDLKTKQIISKEDINIYSR